MKYVLNMWKRQEMESLKCGKHVKRFAVARGEQDVTEYSRNILSITKYCQTFIKSICICFTYRALHGICIYMWNYNASNYFENKIRENTK